MAVREYSIRGYRNTGYSSGAPDSAEFDRPFSREVFESLYPDGDKDVIELQEPRSWFLLRETYYKESIKIRWEGTQKDIIYQIDYLRIKATNGENPETVYYFVDTSRTQWLSATTAILYLELDEQTTANASQTVEMNGIIEKRQYNIAENKLNFYPENFLNKDPLETTIAYITAETGKGYTVVAGVPKATGVKHFAGVHCDLGGVLQDPPVVNPLPSQADSLTVKIVGAGGEDVIFRIDGMVLVDTDNSVVKQALNKLRETGNEGMIGSTFCFPQQTLRVAPITYTSNGVELIKEIVGGDFHFIVDNMPLIPTYGNIYSGLRNPKAGYQFVTYTLVAPSSGDTKSYTLQEIIEGATGDSPLSLPEEQMKFIGSGVPIAQGGMYWRPAGLSQITPVSGYDSRVIYIEAVRGSDWNDYGLSLTGVANAELLSMQVKQAEDRFKIDKDMTESQYALSKANIEIARMQSGLGLAGGVAGVLGSGGNTGKAMTGLFNLLGSVITASGIGKGEDLLDFSVNGSPWKRQMDQAEVQRNLANSMNELGLKSVKDSADYTRRNQSLSVLPPTGLDMNRVMGSSALIIRTSLSNADVIRYDNELYWEGMTVHETYSGKLKDHDYLLSTGEDFAYVKLGMCTISLPDEPSGWANSLAWRRKIQAELQTGGRYWKKKRNDYNWDVPIPVDGGYVPGGSGDRVYYENLIAEGAPTTKSLEVKINEDLPLEDLEFVIAGAEAGEITKIGYGEYDIKLVVGSFVDRAPVSVTINAEGKSFTPKRRSVAVIKEWQPSKIGADVEWISAETEPWVLGFELVASNEVSIEKHYLLWKESNNFIITTVERDKHMFVSAVEGVVLDEPSEKQGLAIVGGELKLVHSGGYDLVNIVDVMTGVQTTVGRITGKGSTKAVGFVGYGNFLVECIGDRVTNVHRYFPNSCRSRAESFYGARPFRYPFLYLKPDSFAQAVGTMFWWEAVTALDEETDGSAVEVSNSNILSIGRNVDDLIASREPAPQTTVMEFFGNWKALADPDNQALRRLVPVGDTMTVAVWDDTVQLGGAVYPQGMYLNRAGDWYYRYTSGEERLVPEVLAPMMQKSQVLPFWTDGSKVYRILG